MSDHITPDECRQAAKELQKFRIEADSDKGHPAHDWAGIDGLEFGGITLDRAAATIEALERRLAEAERRARLWERGHDARTAEVTTLKRQLAEARPASSPDTDYIRSVSRACRERRADQDEAANVLATCADDLDAARAELADLRARRAGLRVDIEWLRAERDRLQAKCERAMVAPHKCPCCDGTGERPTNLPGIASDGGVSTMPAMIQCVTCAGGGLLFPGGEIERLRAECAGYKLELHICPRCGHRCLGPDEDGRMRCFYRPDVSHNTCPWKEGAHE